jgi:hypothetical protein
MKPVIFISHIHEHRQLGTAIKEEIAGLLLGGVDFFVSSDGVSIVGGDRWLDQVETALNNAAIVLVLCSPDSVHRPWVNFEAGGAWMAKKRVVPLCCGGLRPSDLPQPLASRQAYDITSPEDLKDLVGLIAREAGLNAPDFSAEDLAETFSRALLTPADETDQEPSQMEFRNIPQSIRAEFKLRAHDFFDDVYEHDARDNARSRVDKEEEDILSQLRALLAMRFGPTSVKLDYSGIKFPAGVIRSRRCEDLRSSGYESSVWCEITIEIDGQELALLTDIRTHDSLRYAKCVSVSFLFPGTIDLSAFAEDLFNRKIEIKSFGKQEIAFGKLDIVGAEVAVKGSDKTVSIQLSDYDFKELELNNILGPIFNYLKIADHISPVGDDNGS